MVWVDPVATSQPTPAAVSKSALAAFCTQTSGVGNCVSESRHGEATSAFVQAQPLTQPRVPSIKAKDCNRVER
eukprot:5005730-Pleurochrysis_carterae.AAC.1